MKLNLSKFDPRKIDLTKVKIGNFGPAVGLFAGFTKKGLALIADGDLILERLPKYSVTLVLKWPEVIVICLVLVALGFGVRWWPELAQTWVISKWAPEHANGVAGIIGVVAIVVGTLLAIWKKRQLFVYGISEIAFGAFTAIEVGLVLFPKKELSQLIGLGSAVYVVSRGAFNLIDAVEKEIGFTRVRLEKEEGKPPEPWPPSIINLPRAVEDEAREAHASGSSAASSAPPP